MNILGMFFLATFIEGIITYIFGSNTNETPRPWLKYISLLLGASLAIIYKIDLLAEVGLLTNLPFISFVVTGIIIGRGSNYLNDIIKLIGTKVGSK